MGHFRRTPRLTLFHSSGYSSAGSVAIVGRPNVGKSALFNRLAGRGISVVHNQPGTTRDCVVAVCYLGKSPFKITDTGGVSMEWNSDFSSETTSAAEAAMKDAELLLFMADAQTGVVPLDKELSKWLHATARRPLILVVNKIDHEGQESMVADFASLGFEFCIGVSAIHGRGITELILLIDRLLSDKTKQAAQTAWKDAPRITVVGRPNVGKSSLINAILEEDRMIVSEVPGTTRDTVDVTCTCRGACYTFCDTAGIRHPSKGKASVEAFSIVRSMKAIEHADLCLLALDAQSGVTSQDKKIAGLIQKACKAVVILLNKWDLVKPQDGQQKFLRELAKETKRDLFFINFAPVVMLSAKTREHVQQIFTVIRKVSQCAACRIGTGELNRLLQDALRKHPPPVRRNRRLKVYYSTQVHSEPCHPFPTPRFLLFVNDPGLLVGTYQTYLIGQIRKHLGFPGLPIELRLQGK
ncbi:GTPase Der [Candidatus Xiphinematobacter sp. Idaho Grape]|uniref:ribosome biogenesis GTPase Der n=1 Tax=Candidatus Xiphinematobacter sp. Idaho Grape TaxID=1704307 RepID=UPI0007064191|nr:ribosome biogenesis GTPase Der [Candidatus Xiphinematobacter sp. Idaho Grape]ALJ56854.1 GTPase Der [Candidatus Xiphinematobacter sp. Idaho Grape]